MPDGFPFKLGECYTRSQISKELGGDTVSYLPGGNGRVVCGCFDPALNPDAPSVVLVGDGPAVSRRAEWLCEQEESIPVFVKRDANRWEYTGLFRVDRWTCRDDQIEPLAKAAHRENELVRVIWLKLTGWSPDPVGNAPPLPRGV